MRRLERDLVTYNVEAEDGVLPKQAMFCGDVLSDNATRAWVGAELHVYMYGKFNAPAPLLPLVPDRELGGSRYYAHCLFCIVEKRASRGPQWGDGQAKGYGLHHRGNLEQALEQARWRVPTWNRRVPYGTQYVQYMYSIRFLVLVDILTNLSVPLADRCLTTNWYIESPRVIS